MQETINLKEHKLTALKLTNEARVLADKYIEEGIIPKKYLTDALQNVKDEL